jgi:hypothetical protein
MYSVKPVPGCTSRRSLVLGMAGSAAVTAGVAAPRPVFAASPAPPSPAPLQRTGPGPFAVTQLPLALDSPPPGMPPAAAPVAALRLPAAGPAAAAPGLPLVAFCPGFLVQSAQYSNLLDHLCSWGFPVASYDVAPDAPFLPDPLAAALLGAVADAGARAAAARRGPSSGVYFLGHR